MPPIENTLAYRQGTMADINQLKTLALTAYGQFADTLGPEHWATMSSNLNNIDKLTDLMQKATCFVCTDGNEIVGMAYILPSGNLTNIFQDDWSYIRLVGVHPQYAGNGIAKKLTQLCIDHAVAANERTIALHTSEFMDAARHIYEGFGFTKLKEIDRLFGKRYWVYTLAI